MPVVSPVEQRREGAREAGSDVLISEGKQNTAAVQPPGLWCEENPHVSAAETASGILKKSTVIKFSMIHVRKH